MGREGLQGDTVSPGQAAGLASPEERHDPEEHGEEEEDRQALVEKVKHDALHQLHLVGASRTTAAEGGLVGKAVRTYGHIFPLGVQWSKRERHWVRRVMDDLPSTSSSLSRSSSP